MALSDQNSVRDNHTLLHFIQGKYMIGMPSAFLNHCTLKRVQTKEFKHLH